jgi:hypothetical protein
MTRLNQYLSLCLVIKILGEKKKIINYLEAVLVQFETKLRNSYIHIFGNVDVEENVRVREPNVKYINILFSLKPYLAVLVGVFLSSSVFFFIKINSYVN